MIADSLTQADCRIAAVPGFGGGNTASAIARLGRTTGAFLLAGGLMACSLADPEIPTEVLRDYPIERPTATSTDFHHAMVCMDNLLLISNANPIYVTSQGIFNFTSERALSNGGKEILISSLAQMSVRSQGVHFVGYGADVKDVLDLQGAHPDKHTFRVPDYYIRGGVTQHNKSFWDGQHGAGASFELGGEDDVTTSISNQRTLGTVTVDLSVGYVANLQTVPGVASSNSMALESSTSRALTADLLLGDIGLTYSLTDNISQDFNTLYRALIQIGLIEIVGKVQKVPYWHCLRNMGSYAEREKEIARRFRERLEDGSLEAFTRLSLVDLKYLAGPLEGVFDDEARAALATFQADQLLVASGEIDFDTFRIMNLFNPLTLGATLNTPHFRRPGGGLPVPYDALVDTVPPES